MMIDCALNIDKATANVIIRTMFDNDDEDKQACGSKDDSKTRRSRSPSLFISY